MILGFLSESDTIAVDHARASVHLSVDSVLVDAHRKMLDRLVQSETQRFALIDRSTMSSGEHSHNELREISPSL